MEMKTLQKQKKLSDAEQTIADIRAFRWEESKKIKTFEDVERYCREARAKYECLLQHVKKKKNLS
ncbi:hypothetical protein HZA98_04835 [Candidatus Woesearchaeota archaeon]|nr:hypothetical protein [Candidatus Woesearchaeota archaeon]